MIITIASENAFGGLGRVANSCLIAGLAAEFRAFSMGLPWESRMLRGVPVSIDVLAGWTAFGRRNNPRLYVVSVPKSVGSYRDTTLP